MRIGRELDLHNYKWDSMYIDSCRKPDKCRARTIQMIRWRFHWIVQVRSNRRLWLVKIASYWQPGTSVRMWTGRTSRWRLGSRSRRLLCDRETWLCANCALCAAERIRQASAAAWNNRSAPRRRGRPFPTCCSHAGWSSVSKCGSWCASCFYLYAN